MLSSTIGAAHRSWVALLCGLALGCVLLRAQDPSSGFDDLAAKAEAARDAGDAGNAIRYYQAALQLRPQWEEGWWYLGTVLYDSDRFGDAVAPFQHVTQLDPKLGPAWAFLGLCEFELGQYPESLEHLQRAQTLGFAENPELRKVALGVCTRDFGTPCIHEHSCVRCPQLRPDPAQEPRLLEIRDNLQARITEAHREGWLGEIAGLEATLGAAEHKLKIMRQIADRHPVTHLGMPSFRDAVGRAST